MVQHPVGPFFLDLAYPSIRLAIEYDGETHRLQERAMRDLDRQAYLTDAGWKVLRFTAAQVMRRPTWVAARVREELVKAGRRRGVAVGRARPAGSAARHHCAGAGGRCHARTRSTAR